MPKGDEVPGDWIATMEAISARHPPIDWTCRSLDTFIDDFINKDGVEPTTTWPVENLTKRTFDPIDRDGLKGGPLEEWDGGEFKAVMAVAADLKDLPLHPERGPVTTSGEEDTSGFSIPDEWIRHVADMREGGAFELWYSSFVLISFYRRLVPRAYRSARHMRLVRAIAVCFERCLMTGKMVDDAFDKTDANHGVPTWHTLHPDSFVNDICVMRELARCLFTRLLARSAAGPHPCHLEIGSRLCDLLRHISFLYSYPAGLADRQQRQLAAFPSEADSEKRRYIPTSWLSFRNLDAHNFHRSDEYYMNLIDIARLLACYRDVAPLDPADARGRLYRETIVAYSRSIVYVDEIFDCGAEQGDASLDDIQSGGMYNGYAVHLAEKMRSGEMSPEEAAEVERVLAARYGSGRKQDAIAVRDLYAKHHVKEAVHEAAKASLDEFLVLAPIAKEVLGFPAEEVLLESTTLFSRSHLAEAEAEGRRDLDRAESIFRQNGPSP